MAKSMKAAVVHAFGEPLRIEEVPIPTPGRGQILVNIRASGVCHTDLHAADGDWPVKPRLPFIPGHEGVGFVAAVGEGVTAVKEGDRVGVPWLYTACGHCEHCLSGWETLCHDQQNTGYSVNGGYAEYVLADPNYVGHLPAQVGFEEIAPILCAGVTVYKGIRMTDARPEDAWTGRTGFVHQAVMADHPDLSAHEVYACGAPVMVNAARTDFAAQCRMHPDAFFADSFTSEADLHPAG